MVELFGVRLLGLSWDTLHRAVLTLGFVAVAAALRRLTLLLLRIATRRDPNPRLFFWTRQGASVVTAILIVLSVLSIWFDNPSRLALPASMATAGLAFALQKVIISIAGYVVVLRGKTFSVGDRIVMGGVRGDVISLGFVQTTILEMGQPPLVQDEGPPVWVQARQYTGRVVTVTNDKVFDTPVYNYSREFPFIWEEIRVPISYRCDRARAEQILLDAAREETRGVRACSEQDRMKLKRDYFVEIDDEGPVVYMRLTDNWLELTVRFICDPRNVRKLKDRMTRRILAAFDQAKISIASTTFDVVGLPPLRVEPDLARSLSDAAARVGRDGEGAGRAPPGITRREP
jgi:small-conductance mechanosensitive channel